MANLAVLPNVRRLIELAIEEDLGRGDVTTACTVGDADTVAIADMNARVAMVVYGLDVAVAVFEMIDSRIVVDRIASDGMHATPGELLLTARGPANSILSAERTVLNFVQRLSGVATQARKYAQAVAGTSARVIDTRKTTPGFRVLEKAAVLAGGCCNHRFDLGSGVLIKDNHIVACGSVTAAVTRARKTAPHPLRIEVEVDTFEQLDEALAAKAEVVLLDNMTIEQVKVAVARAHAAGALVEVSGGITLANVADFAKTGADLISVGALTHSSPAVDIGLDFRVA